MPHEGSRTDLDSLFLSRVRLGIMSALAGGDELDFTFLKGVLGTSDGNLGAHLRRLEEAGMIQVHKRFVGRRPKTSYSMTDLGQKTFGTYVGNLAQLLGLQQGNEDTA